MKPTIIKSKELGDRTFVVLAEGIMHNCTHYMCIEITPELFEKIKSWKDNLTTNYDDLQPLTTFKDGLLPITTIPLIDVSEIAAIDSNMSVHFEFYTPLLLIETLSNLERNFLSRPDLKPISVNRRDLN